MQTSVQGNVARLRTDSAAEYEQLLPLLRARRVAARIDAMEAGVIVAIEAEADDKTPLRFTKKYPRHHDPNTGVEIPIQIEALAGRPIQVDASMPLEGRPVFDPLGRPQPRRFKPVVVVTLTAAEPKAAAKPKAAATPKTEAAAKPKAAATPKTEAAA